MTREPADRFPLHRAFPFATETCDRMQGADHSASDVPAS
jgi:hypothetical protein